MKLTVHELGDNRQTQEHGENHLRDSDCPDILPGQSLELPPKEDIFYNKVFVCGKSELSRRELESLPEPPDIYHVTDEQMKQTVPETEMGTRNRLRLGGNESIGFDSDRYSEVWWEEMKETVVRHGILYYEDE